MIKSQEAQLTDNFNARSRQWRERWRQHKAEGKRMRQEHLAEVVAEARAWGSMGWLHCIGVALVLAAGTVTIAPVMALGVFVRRVGWAAWRSVMVFPRMVGLIGHVLHARVTEAK
jgi:hypothetical protein